MIKQIKTWLESLFSQPDYDMNRFRIEPEYKKEPATRVTTKKHKYVTKQEIKMVETEMQLGQNSIEYIKERLGVANETARRIKIGKHRYSSQEYKDSLK